MTNAGLEMPAGTEKSVPAGTPQLRLHRSSWSRRDRIIGLFAVAPALIGVLGFMIYPVLYGVYISLNNYDGDTFRWIGFRNYINLIRDPLVHQIFLTNLKFLISVPLIIFASIVVAVLLFERVRGWKFFRVVYFAPTVLSAVVIGIMFRSAFGYYGPFNNIVVKLGGRPIDFFTNTNRAIFVILLALVWAGFGYSGLLILSGLTSINPEIFESSAIDGAGWWKRLWYITLPNIRRHLGFVFIINVRYTFMYLFGFIFVITAGGPGYGTTTIDYLVFLKAFSSGANMGAGAALAVMLFLFIGLLTLLQAKFFKITAKD